MASGIRATVEFTNPDLCPLVELSEEAATSLDVVSRSVCLPDCTTCICEFIVEEPLNTETDAEAVFSYGSAQRYRFSHQTGIDCPCECIEQFGCPVDRYGAEKGSLTLVFYAADYDQLQTVITDLRERFAGVNVTRLIQSPADTPQQDTVPVDRGRLTERQQEVLETAYEMGYFDRPRGANATEVAAELDIDPSTFSEHLAAAQTKLLEDLFDDNS